jgi:hypothetical protein
MDPVFPNPSIMPESPQMPARHPWRTSFLVAGVVFLAIVVAVVAVLLVTKRNEVSNPAPSYTPSENPTPTLPPDIEAPTSTLPSANPLPGQIVVDWYQWPVPSSISDIYDFRRVEQLKKADASFQNPINDLWRVYRVGQVSAGPYVGGKVYIALGEPEMTTSLYRLVVTPNGDGYGVGEVVAIKNASADGISLTSYPSNINTLWTINTQSSFANLEPPETILIPDSSITLRRGEETPNNPLLLQQLENPTRLFEYAPGRYVYKSEQHNCFFVAASDGTVRPYYFNWSFMDENATNIKYNSYTAHSLSLTFANGAPESVEYVMRNFGGCGGFGSCYNYATYITTDSQLEPVATTPDGQLLYGLKDISVKSRPQSTKTLLREMYDYYYPGPNTNKVSFEVFVADHPVLFWKDPFGDYIQFTKASYTPAAECGKPVIYLYPTKEMDVTVQVAPTGGFTVTEPQYPTGGWKVRAKPSGELYYYADSKTYPYLFWEGFGLNYQRPAEGFVVARKDVEQFLRTTLPKLGLLPHEYDEFIQFWLPKMQAEPYYFVSFMPQAEFDQYAPLAVSPKPDTVIRVFMDYEGLNAPMAVRQPEIRTPERNGFTVVEWGGALH